MIARNKYRLAVVGIVVLAGWACLHFGVADLADSIARPPRRDLQPYHFSWLNGAEDHAVRIERIDCHDGDAPCLVVMPRAGVEASVRGAVIRSQLAGMGTPPPAAGGIHGTLVLLHGRKGRKEDLLPVAERFCAAGFRCVIPDMPAHGESPIATVRYGSGPGEGDFAERVLRDAADELGFSAKPAGIWGISMGGAYTAAALSGDAGVWKGAVIVSSFDSLDTVIREQSRAKAWRFGPILSSRLRHVLRGRHDLDSRTVVPATWLRDSGIPVMVAHGARDSLFPIARGRALHDAAAARHKRWIEVDGGGHDNVLVTDMPLYATMAAWFIRHVPE